MWNQQTCVSVVVVVLGVVASVRAAIPGPTDPRYPDTIVQPRVNCVKEGSFPHPRNCSWYYRCVDRMNVGYFWTYYFECEPGTVFSDDLDQCVHPMYAGPPCGNPVTTEAPTTPEVIPCTGVPGTCKTYDICRPQKVKKLLCEKLQCPLRSPHLQCAEGYFFDMDDRICVKPPSPASLCGADTVTPIDVKEQGQLPCSYSNLRPASEFISRLYCDTYALCDGKIYKGQKELCRSYYECQQDGTVWAALLRSCPLGLLYSYDLDRCVPAPKDTELCK